MGESDVTGARVDLELLLDVPVERMWEMVTQVSRIGEWSPECVHAAPLGDGPVTTPGARFEGRNRFGNGFVGEVTCVVTVAERPRTFEWVVLDRSGDPDRPGSRWRYDLEPGETAARTLVRHSFVHGPGDSGMRRATHEDPDQAATLVADRLAQLRAHMTQTLRGMERSDREMS
ncbi:SRPBCC family protein [Actinopolymorpha pittospori]|uniref:Uncharacterized protein YndB with AHSA1/START domain n=1 Tax=Actinopolymorpha pittospori TaxID=648752 RepID=A0A927MVK7_9ACTN|nr:SRPBCC family protein [Actinopolymorpha pittospori]MBE1606053.1 uncharacterized protein YndB with AHSA1/START domain [Actinopolymorpha pittospori]